MTASLGDRIALVTRAMRAGDQPTAVREVGSLAQEDPRHLVEVLVGSVLDAADARGAASLRASPYAAPSDVERLLDLVRREDGEGLGQLVGGSLDLLVTLLLCSLAALEEAGEAASSE